MSDSRPQGLTNGAGKVMVGIYDFSYGPYALGDALTWQMNLGVLAAEHGCDAIDEYLVVRPMKPSNRLQPFVTQHHYVSVIDGLLPAFLCSPKMRSLKLIRNGPGFNLFLLREAMRRRPNDVAALRSQHSLAICPGVRSYHSDIICPLAPTQVSKCMKISDAGTRLRLAPTVLLVSYSPKFS